MNILKKTLQKKASVTAGVITESINRRDIKKAALYGADILEIRLDTLKDLTHEKAQEELKKLKEITRLPVLLTLRSKKEGGRADITDKERLSIIRSAIDYADAVDIELGSRLIAKDVIDLAHKRGKQAIVSYHNFKTTPGTKALEDIIKGCRAIGADLIKIAAFVNKNEDLRRLASLLSTSSDLIVIAMGPKGIASRVFFPALGSKITYASVTCSTAPGQLPLRELTRELGRYGIRA